MNRKKHGNIIVPEDPPKGPSALLGVILLFVAPPVSTILGLYLLMKRAKAEWTRKQYREFRQYAAISQPSQRSAIIE